MDQEYVIGWGTLALLNAGLALCMARSRILWLALSILVGPIATFCLVLLGPVAPAPKPETIHRHRGRGDEGFPL